MKKEKYAAFLRGINVGGKHKVPMAELRDTFESLGFTSVKTLLNSGNAIFRGDSASAAKLESRIAPKLEKTFGFPIPVMVRTESDIRDLINSDPFSDVEVHKDIRLYVTFLKDRSAHTENRPDEAPGFRIVELRENCVCSVLDLTEVKTPDAMSTLKKTYGPEITTRNWNTVLKIGKALGEL